MAGRNMTSVYINQEIRPKVDTLIEKGLTHTQIYTIGVEKAYMEYITTGFDEEFARVERKYFEMLERKEEIERLKKAEVKKSRKKEG